MSEIWLEREWINRVSPFLERFKWQHGRDSANFRCNICGDSKKSKLKARGHFFVNKTNYFFKCHNCGESMPFYLFLKKFFPNEYREFTVERFRRKQGDAPRKKEKTKAPPKVKIKTSRKLTELPKGHIALQYCESRKIPEDKYDRISYAAYFTNWLKEEGLFKDKHEALPNDPRLMFMICDKDGNASGVCARALDPDTKMRYIMTKFHDNSSSVYGLDFVNLDEDVFVTEGVIDSLFLPNALALCGGDVREELNTLPKEKLIMIFDNEPRHKDTTRRMRRAIDLGYRVAFWEGVPTSFKDVNDVILAGVEPKTLVKLFRDNVHSGAAAVLALQQWSRL